jgi:hypothetical protein
LNDKPPQPALEPRRMNPSNVYWVSRNLLS